MAASPLGAARVAPYLFLAPYGLLTLVFFLYPFFNALHLAFHQTHGPLSRVWVGLENFRFILGHDEFHTALRNTLIYAAANLLLLLPVSLGLALLLNARRSRWKGAFRLILFSPHLVGPIFVGILFAVIFVPRYGLLNRFLHDLVGWGLDLRWLQQPELVMPALVITSLWLHAGYNMVYFLAALQSVDEHLVEAARIDGANPWQVFLHVTLPAIKPVALFVLVVSTISSLQLFELPYALLQGPGPGNAGLTVVGYLYTAAFEAGDLGLGAAVGWTLALLIFSVSLLQLQLTRRWASED